MHRAVKSTIILFLLALLPAACTDKCCEPKPYDYLEVPSEFATIQMAVDAAQQGDTILLAPGTYEGEGNFNIEIDSISLTIRSMNGPVTTVIQGDPGWTRTLTISNCVGPRCALLGLTFSGGRFGIQANDSRLLVRNCVFREIGFGFAVKLNASTLDAQNCDFSNDVASVIGIGTIVADRSWLEFRECNFNDDAGLTAVICVSRSLCGMSECLFVNSSGGLGSAVYLSDSRLYLFSSTVWRSMGSMAIYSDPIGELTISNCIIAESEQAPLYVDSRDSAVINCCNFYGSGYQDWLDPVSNQLGVRGNISVDPKFVDPENGDFRLCPDSPCAPENNDCGVLMGAFPVADNCP
jgi:hypothetical protein